LQQNRNKASNIRSASPGALLQNGKSPCGAQHETVWDIFLKNPAMLAVALGTSVAGALVAAMMLAFVLVDATGMTEEQRRNRILHHLSDLTRQLAVGDCHPFDYQ
jgi:hypothetical protein